MSALRHKQSRYLYQILWLAILAVLALSGASLKMWLGLLLPGLFSALLVKRAACSCVCPLFPVGELLWRSGEQLFGRTFTPPFWLDLALRTGKYLVLGWVVLAFAVGSLPEMAWARPSAPMLIAALLVLSLFFQMPWCRYLCPYGALLGLISIASVLTIRRNPRHCVRCHKCSSHCPASLPVMMLDNVRSPECFACQRCVDGCPAPGALAFATPGKRTVPAWHAGAAVSGMLIAGVIAGMFL